MWLRGSPIKSADASVEEKRIAQERMIEGGTSSREDRREAYAHDARQSGGLGEREGLVGDLWFGCADDSEIEVLETDPERLLATRGVPALSREAKVVGGKALAEDEIARLLEAA